MTERGVQAGWRSLASRSREALARRLVWVADGRCTALGQPSDRPALVAVLGREHYQERRKSYPVRGWRDLARVLRLELAGAPPTLTLIGPLVDERREVTFFQIEPRAMARVGRALWLVPESLLLSQAMPRRQVAVVERDGLRYFLAANGVSQIAGGAVRDARVFALAVGMDEDRAPVAMGRADILDAMLPGIRRLPLAAWSRLVCPGLGGSLGIAWRPLGTLAAGFVVAYLVAGSVYLQLTESMRGRELEALGPEVASLLDAQREVERLAAERQGIAGVLAARLPTYEVWRLVAQAVARGATFNGLSLLDGRLTLRGSAPAATEVLAGLAADGAVRNARFAAPVRQSGGGEQFVIDLELAPGAAGE